MFIEEPRFPDDVSEGAQGGPRYSTSVVSGLNGRKVKNVNWTYPLHSYDVSFSIRTFENLDRVLEFFHVAEGAAHSFRFKDWHDYKSCSAHDDITPGDQVIGTGNGSEVRFQLVKNYRVGSYVKTRRIQKPVPGTVICAINGSPTSAFTVDSLGVVTFDSAPANGAEVTAGYEFDVPVSFDEDELPTNLDGYDNGSVSVTVTEDRL